MYKLLYKNIFYSKFSQFQDWCIFVNELIIQFCLQSHQSPNLFTFNSNPLTFNSIFLHSNNLTFHSLSIGLSLFPLPSSFKQSLICFVWIRRCGGVES